MLRLANARLAGRATAVFLKTGGKGDHSGRQYELYDGIYLPLTPRARIRPWRTVAYWASLGGWQDGADALSGDKMSGLIDLYSTGGYLQVSKWQIG